MTLRTLILTVTAVLVIGAMPAAAQTTEVLPGLGIRLLEVPADAADDPRANVYITDHVEPGTVIERRVAVSNGTEESMDIRLYGVSATVADGWVVQDGEGGNELAGWIEVEPASITLPAGGQQDVLARITVPAEATGGERYAAVVAAVESGGDGTVQVVSRVGVRVYLSVGGAVAPTEDFVIDTLTGGRDAEGIPYVLIEVTNTGERAVDVTGELSLDDGPGELSAGPFTVALPRTIGPGASGELRVPLDPSLPAGPWNAVADLRSGLLERQAQATITFPEAGEQGDAIDAEALGEDGEPTGLPPLAVGGAILGGAALIGFPLLLLWRRRRKDDDREEGDAAVEPVLLEPLPVEPLPVEPVPVEPLPVEPLPVEPLPVEPSPVEPVPVSLSPVAPAPPAGRPIEAPIVPAAPGGRARPAPVTPPAPPGPRADA